MDMLKQKIISEGTALGSDIVRVDSFLNHQVDPELLKEMGKEFCRLFSDIEITKVLTIESSGIAIAAFVALELGVPFVFAKKYNARNLEGDTYEAEVFSFTKNTSFHVRVAKRYLNKGDKVLIVDDFLANGYALAGLCEIVEAAGGEVSGCGIAIEKSFQGGAERIKEKGYRVESLAKISSIENGIITFSS